MTSSFVESSPLNRDQISIASSSMNSYRGFHQRSYSNQIVSTSLPHPAFVQKLPLQPSLFSSFSSSVHQKSDQEVQTFQTPNTSNIKQNIKLTEKSLEEFLNELSQKKRQQTRTLRCQKIEDLKSDINFKNIVTGQNKESTLQQVQPLNNYNKNYNKDINSSSLNISQDIHSEASTTSPSPLLLQFANMDLRKRASIVPIKPVEMNFNKQLQTKLGSKFNNLKIEGNLEKKHNNQNECEPESRLSSPVETRVNMRKNLLKQFTKLNQNDNKYDDDDNEDQSISDFSSQESELDSDDDNIGFASENLIIEVKSQKHHILKSILKKNPNLNGQQQINKMDENINQNSYQAATYLFNDQNNNTLKPIQYPHQRSNSLTVLPSNYNVNNFVTEQSQQYLNQPKINIWQQPLSNYTPLTSNTTATHTPSTQNILSNRDMNLQLQSFSSFTKDYQFGSIATPTLDKQIQSSPNTNQRGYLRRSQSLTGIIKKVQFNVSNDTNESYSAATTPDAFSSQQQFCKYQQQNANAYINHNNFSSCSQNNLLPPSFLNQTRQKSNSFNKFYSAFKQNLNNSNKSQVFSSPQAKSLNQNYTSAINLNSNNNNHNNSINSNVSTTPSLNSFSQYSNSQINSQLAANSNSSSTSSTPMASQTSIANGITQPIFAQFNYDRKNHTSQNILKTVFKDMKLTKNTKVYFDQKCGQNSPASVDSPSVKSIQISNFNQNDSLQIGFKKEENSPQVKSIPSSEIISLSMNA